MRVIELDIVPNQQQQIVLDGNRWGFVFHDIENETMAVTIDLNDERILSGQRIVAETPLIPYKYLQGSGNFWILTEGSQLPYWEQFASQTFIYMNAAEAAALPDEPPTWPSIASYQLDVLMINSLLINLG